MASEPLKYTIPIGTSGHQLSPRLPKKDLRTHALSLFLPFGLMLFSVLFSVMISPRLEKRELVYTLLVHLLILYAFLACDCGTHWTSFFNFLLEHSTCLICAYYGLLSELASYQCVFKFSASVAVTFLINIPNVSF